MRKKCFLLTTVLAFSLLTATGSLAALAYTTYDLSTPNYDLGMAAPGPYGTVQVAWDNTTNVDEATITFTRSDSFVFRRVGVNVNSTSFNVTQISAINWDFNGAKQFDGFGVMNINVSEGPGGLDQESISFKITNTSSTDWASITSILTGNNLLGNHVAAHIIPSGGLDTGFAGDGTTTSPVPIPAAAWLLGSGLLGLVLVRRRMKK